MSREATRRILTRLDLEVEEAPNGLEGLRWLESHPWPDLILLDLMMPVMDGFEFLKELQKRPELHDIPVVVLTAKQLTADEIGALTGSTERVLAKDATTNLELVAAIRKSLERGRFADTERITEAPSSSTVPA